MYIYLPSAHTEANINEEKEENQILDQASKLMIIPVL